MATKNHHCDHIKHRPNLSICHHQIFSHFPSFSCPCHCATHDYAPINSTAYDVAPDSGAAWCCLQWRRLWWGCLLGPPTMGPPTMAPPTMALPLIAPPKTAPPAPPSASALLLRSQHSTMKRKSSSEVPFWGDTKSKWQVLFVCFFLFPLSRLNETALTSASSRFSFHQAP